MASGRPREDFDGWTSDSIDSSNEGDSDWPAVVGETPPSTPNGGASGQQSTGGIRRLALLRTLGLHGGNDGGRSRSSSASECNKQGSTSPPPSSSAATGSLTSHLPNGECPAPRSNSSVLSPISRLPMELIVNVFSYLDLKGDQRSFMLVQKNWFVIAAENLWFRPGITDMKTLTGFLNVVQSQDLTVPYPLFVRRLNLTNVAETVSDNRVLEALPCRRLERLTLSGCSQLSDESLVPLIALNPAILSIDLSGLSCITDATLLAISESCKDIQGLYASGCTQLSDAGVASLARNCKMLKRVKLTNCANVTSEALEELVDNCPNLTELDVAGCSSVTDYFVTNVLVKLSQLRELRLASNINVSDHAFLSLRQATPGAPGSSSMTPVAPTPHLSTLLQSPATPPTPLPQFDKLRIVDLTSCIQISDASVEVLVRTAPRLRNVVLAKCVNITDRALVYLSQLEYSLHYLHLGHCSNITDRGIEVLVKHSPRLQYIDVACCIQLTNQAVIDLGTLPRLKRIGLVRCGNITDLAIYALAKRKENTLERIHLSYCTHITLLAIRTLVNECRRLTHLSLTGVPAFLNAEFTQFCRLPPREFTQHQQSVFCVFSGTGVLMLRNKLNELEHDRQNNMHALYYVGAGGGGPPPGLPVPPMHSGVSPPGMVAEDPSVPEAS